MISNKATKMEVLNESVTSNHFLVRVDNLMFFFILVLQRLRLKEIIAAKNRSTSSDVPLQTPQILIIHPLELSGIQSFLVIPEVVRSW